MGLLGAGVVRLLWHEARTGPIPNATYGGELVPQVFRWGALPLFACGKFTPGYLRQKEKVGGAIYGVGWRRRAVFGRPGSVSAASMRGVCDMMRPLEMTHRRAGRRRNASIGVAASRMTSEP